MKVNEQTTNVLAAVHLAVYEAGSFGPEVFDTSIADAGERLFGEGWTPKRRGRSIEYAPLVSMTLGRMRKAGLVRAVTVESSGPQRYHGWALTDEGIALAERIFGSAEDLAAAFPEPAGA